MGIYLNPNNFDFQMALNSRIYVDKTGLISYTNNLLMTEQRFICVSRPRRFGKTMAANMLTSYYNRGSDSISQFTDLKIAKNPGFKNHLNRYHVIRLNMQDFLSKSNTMNTMINCIQKEVLFDLTVAFPNVRYYNNTDLVRSLQDIFAYSSIPFIFIIDEWDCVFRVKKNDQAAQTKYLDFLRNLLKDHSYVALAYMTGILPIKKYGQHSALNMFYEYSMMDAAPIQEYTGFTEAEVKELCAQYRVSYDSMQKWYDGYTVNGVSIYNPRSVVESILRGNFNNYWTKTETYEALKIYTQMDFDGLRSRIEQLIAGERVPVNSNKYQNDMTTFESADDVLTLLVHLGYLTSDQKTDTCSIPNREIQQEFINCIEDSGWEHLINAIRRSDELFQLTLSGNEQAVAEQIAKVHEENASILQYNNETSLSCAISLAYYSARKNYSIIREMPAGKGFADLVFVPDRKCSTPAMIVELKWNHSVETALDQIRSQQYVNCLDHYKGKILLVGINYDKETKIHTCKIEHIDKL